MASSLQRFVNQRALVTGASKGIGRAIALQLAQEGAHVVALGRAVSDLESLKKEHANIVETICVDLDDVQATKDALSNMAPVDLLVNNAGMANLQSFLDTDPEVFDKTMAVNARSIVVVSQIVARHMIESKKGGVIVNISSQAGIRPLRDHTSYCASKAAVDHLTRTMALELGPCNIRVNSVNPTVVMTEMGRMAWSDEAKAGPMLSRIPLRRFAELSDIVGPVLFLLSNDSAMITGITLPVDGGFCAT